MQPTDPAPFPLDFDALRKGDVVSPETIEDIYGCPRSDRAYSMKLLILRDKIIKERRRRGSPVTVRAEGDSLVILTDSESAEYNASECESAVRSIRSSHRRSMEVDVGNLTNAERDRHLRALQMQAMQIVAISKARRASLKLPTPEPSPRAIEG